jgi:alpha-L-fucosidase 2
MKNGSSPLRLWYEHPAVVWEEALPIGNGRLGGMVFGGIQQERILLNEDTLWSGFPKNTNDPDVLRHLDEVRRLLFAGNYLEAQHLAEGTMLGPWNESYQPMGDLRLEFAGVEHIERYTRELDLDRAVATTRFQAGSSLHSRETFISAPDQVLVERLSCTEPGRVSFIASLDSLLPHTTSRGNGPELVMTLSGRCPAHVEPSYVEDCRSPVVFDPDSLERAMTFTVRIQVLHEGGISESTDSAVSVRNADSAVILLTAATSYGGFDWNHAATDIDPFSVTSEQMDTALNRSQQEMVDRHVEDHHRLFRRVELDLGNSAASELPTDRRLAGLAAGGWDPDLFALLFQYGRYLLIASSRPGTQPANLQGIWSREVRPPWSSNWTTNINLEMNYWPAETCNLSECHEPLMRLIDDLRKTGSETARVQYGCRGWVVHHNVDLWRTPTAVGGSARWALWPMASAWLSLHAWEHYLFTLDEEFLECRAYPAMKEAAWFLQDWLVEDGNGHLITCPSTSPENAFLTPGGEACSIGIGSTMDLSLIQELFSACIEAARRLSTDEGFVVELENVLHRLPPFRTGRHGQLLEYSEDFEETEPGHRHLSHLFSVFPGSLMTTSETPQWIPACRTSLDRRGDEGTGWSLAWKIALRARLGDGDHALKLVSRLMRPASSTGTNYVDGGGTYPNLMDAHPPFQIDGNFGVTAGIAEMLLQSHERVLCLLPALPSEWREGRVHGLCAREGFEIDMRWSGGQLEEATIHSKSGIPCRVRYRGREIEIPIAAGQSVRLHGPSMEAMDATS